MKPNEIDACVISRNVQLSDLLLATAIYVSSDGRVFITTDSMYANEREILPTLSVEYLDALCSKHYFGGYGHQGAIADILLLHDALTKDMYDDFYSALRSNLAAGNITIVSSQLAP